MFAQTNLSSLEQWPKSWDDLLIFLNKDKLENIHDFWKIMVNKYVTTTLQNCDEETYKEYFHQFWTKEMPKLSNNPFHIIEAADKGYDAYIKNFLTTLSDQERQKLLDCKLGNKDTALHVASGNGYVAVVKELLEKGANPNAIGDLGETPLHRAAYYNRGEVITILLNLKASCEQSRNDQLKPIHVAAMAGSSQAIETLVKHDSKQLSIVGKEGRTAQFTAAENGQYESLQTIFANGGDINRVNPHTGQTLLHFAVHKRNRPLMAWLLDHHASVNALDTSKFTPLQRVAMTSLPSVEIADILISHGADVNAGGPPPIFLLATEASQSAKQTVELAELLVKNGADVNAKHQGKTAFEILSERKENQQLKSEQLGLYNFFKKHLSSDKKEHPAKKSWFKKIIP